MTDIISRLHSGADLSIFLHTDPDATDYLNPQPEYIESYRLPFVVIEGDQFWGMSTPAHLAHSLKSGAISINAFMYGSKSAYYGSSTQGSQLEMASKRQIPTRLLPKHQYARFEWHTNDRYIPVWESSKPNETDDVRQAIENGKKFRVLIRIDELLTLVLPTDLVFYYPENKNISIRTECAFCPGFFIQPKAFDKQLNAALTAAGKSWEDPDIKYDFNALAFSLYYNISSEGFYYGLDDIPSGRKNPLPPTILFAEK